jgi:hypothetical protein
MKFKIHFWQKIKKIKFDFNFVFEKLCIVKPSPAAHKVSILAEWVTPLGGNRLLHITKRVFNNCMFSIKKVWLKKEDKRLIIFLD